MAEQSTQIVLVTGPTRSGKSEWAEHLAERSNLSVVYVATSRVDPEDAEWMARIERHRQRRPDQWQVREVPVDLAQAVREGNAGDCLLVDSLGTWLANLLELETAEWDQVCEDLVESLQQTPARVVLVAEEVGWGVVPAYPLGRLFCDRMGQLTRRVGAISDAVFLVTAGYAIDVRQWGQPVP